MCLARQAANEKWLTIDSPIVSQGGLSKFASKNRCDFVELTGIEPATSRVRF